MKARAAFSLLTGSEAAAAARLASWFTDHQRDLPWRLPTRVNSGGTQVSEPRPGFDDSGDEGPSPRRDPYRTWISEIMLQQTQVATVMEYFRRWMERFPDIAALAAAEEADVLEAWAGLGYYSRARNILTTARQVVAEHGGLFPWRRADLLGLKGIGEYTAGAISSIAFNRPEPILDGNLVRVFSRLYGLGFLPDAKEGKTAYWALSRTWAESHVPALVNEGLMELGALVCTPRNPRCGSCPLSGFCRAFAQGLQDDFPPPKSRKEAVDVTGYAVAAFREGEVLLYRPEKPERLAGLLTFPTFPAADLPGLRDAWNRALPALADQAFRPRPVTVTHSITHHRYRLRIAETRVQGSAARAGLPDRYVWTGLHELDRLLVSSLPSKIWKAIR